MLKKNFKNIIGVIITLLLTVSLVQYMGHRLDPAWSQDGYDVIEAFHSLEEDTLDVIVYGSSHAWKGCDTRVMWDKYGLNAYNYGCNWQVLNTTKLFFEDSLRTQTPKVVCVETYLVNNLLRNTNMDGQIYYTRAIPFFDGKIEYIMQCFGRDPERYLSYVFPLVMFHDNWTNINSENYLMQGHQRFVDSRGYFIQTAANPFEPVDYASFPQYELNEDCKAILDEMVKACEEEGTEIVFFTCPYAGEYNYNNAMKRYAEENDCTYLNLFEYTDKMGFDWETDLADGGHLNVNGAGKVAAFLGEYIVENYDIEN